MMSGEQEFAELLERNRGSVARFLQRFLGNVHDAEDLTQETIARAYKNRHKYEPKYGLSGWLITIARNLAISFRRNQDPASVPLDEYAGHEAAVSDHAQDRGLWEAARQALGSGAYAMIWLRYGEGLSVSEIAERTGRSEIVIRVTLHRARLKLMKSRNFGLCLKGEK
jgi:RNA polymerase sigma factor (sigma-70 family)